MFGNGLKDSECITRSQAQKEAPQLAGVPLLSRSAKARNLLLRSVHRGRLLDLIGGGFGGERVVGFQLGEAVAAAGVEPGAADIHESAGGGVVLDRVTSNRAEEDFVTPSSRR